MAGRSVNKMKVLHILEGLFAGGTENVVMNWNRHMEHPLFQFDFLVNNTQPIYYEEEIKKLGGKILAVPQRKAGIKSILSYTHAVYRTLKKNHYDAVVSHMGYIAGFELLAARLAGVRRRIAVAHMGYYYDTNRIKIGLYKFLIWLFATDNWAVSQAAGKMLFWSRFTVIKNGIDLNRFSFKEDTRRKIRAQLGWQDAWIIGMVGRLAEEKNHLFLLNVFKSLSTDFPTMRLLIIGSGRLQNMIEKQIKNLHLEEKVKMAGTVSHVEDFYAAMDCLVLPSKYEGAPLTPVEAQAEGLPVLISEAVPGEVKIINTQQLPLEDASLWEKSLANLFQAAPERNFSHAQEALRQAGFDICVEVKRIEKLLQEFEDANK